jgi:hypothetical protein
MVSAHASVGTVDITPRKATPLAGTSIRDGKFTAIADRLEANVVVLRSDGPPLVLLSADLLFVGRELRAGVLSQLGGAVQDESLFLAASHTHFAPATDGRRPRLGRMDPDYLEQVSDQVADLIAAALAQPPVPVTIDYVKGQADHAINRRLRTPWHLSRRGLLIDAVVGAPNPSGPRDETIHLLRISPPTGGPLALVWSYACHPVGFPRPLEVTAEFPGRARRRLRQEYGADLPVLFWQGFAGDVRPPELDRATSLASRVRRLVLGPRFGRFTGEEWERWSDSLAARVAQTASASPQLRLGGSLAAGRVVRPLSEFVIGATDDRQVVFHRIVLGGGLTIVGVSAEVVTEYGRLVREAFPDTAIVPVGYIDEVYGYLPTARMIEEGGYEASWFLEPFGIEGRLNPSLERHCRAALRELAEGPAA